MQIGQNHISTRESSSFIISNFARSFLQSLNDSVVVDLFLEAVEEGDPVRLRVAIATKLRMHLELVRLIRDRADGDLQTASHLLVLPQVKLEHAWVSLLDFVLDVVHVALVRSDASVRERHYVLGGRVDDDRLRLLRQQ